MKGNDIITLQNISLKFDYTFPNPLHVMEWEASNEGMHFFPQGVF